MQNNNFNYIPEVILDLRSLEHLSIDSTADIVTLSELDTLKSLCLRGEIHDLFIYDLEVLFLDDIEVVPDSILAMDIWLLEIRSDKLKYLPDISKLKLCDLVLKVDSIFEDHEGVKEVIKNGVSATINGKPYNKYWQ